jgi:hypothetical protein
VPGHVYATTIDQLQSNDLVQGMILVAGQVTLVFFYSGSTHSFTSVDCTNWLGLLIEPLIFALNVCTPVENTSLYVSHIWDLSIELQGQVLPTNLVLLDMKDYDVIWRIDWLFEHYGSISC